MGVNHHIIELIISEIKGDISKNDKDKLHAWVNESDENYASYQSHRELYNKAREIHTYKSIDKDLAWINLNKAINSKKIHIFSWKKYASVAAVFIALIGSSLLWILPKHEVSNNELAKYNEVVIETEEGIVIKADSVSEIEALPVIGGHLQRKENRLFYKQDAKSLSSELNTLLVPRGKDYKLTLADGSELMANAETKIVFPTVFNEDSRRIWLAYGEIFINVAHNAGKPFTVSTNGVDIQVLGTKFNVNAYSENEYVQITLAEGKISVFADGSEDVEFETVNLSLGQQLEVNFATEKNYLRKADVKMTTAWTRGEFYFEDESLENIMKTLARWYNYEIEFEQEKHKQIIFTGKIKKYESVQNFLNALGKLEDITLEIKENKIVIK